MKIAVSIPLAVAATLTLPRMEEVFRERDELALLEKTLQQKQKQSEELLSLRKALENGESVTMQHNSELPVNLIAPEALQTMRQEVLALQQEHEDLRLLLGELEFAQASEPKVATNEEPQPNPFIKTDHWRLAQALYRAGKFQESLKALAQTESRANVALLAASCLEKLNRTEEAIVAYKKVMELFPNTPEAKQAETVQVYLETRRKLGRSTDYDRFLAEFETQEQKDPESKKE